MKVTHPFGWSTNTGYSYHVSMIEGLSRYNPIDQSLSSVNSGTGTTISMTGGGRVSHNSVAIGYISYGTVGGLPTQT